MNEKYAGNGHLTGAVGKGTIAAGITLGIGALAEVVRNSDHKPHITGAALAAAVVIGGMGAVLGWKQADAGIKQYEQTAQKADMLETAITNAVHEGVISITPSLELHK